MQFTRAHLEEILVTSWPVAARLVAWARTLLGNAGDGALPRPLALELRRILRPAESFIRRLIVIMACRMKIAPQDLPRPRAAKPSATPSRPVRLETKSADSAASAPRALSPVESFPVSFTHAPPRAAAAPGIWFPGRPRLQILPQPKPIFAAGFIARLAKLEAALADPEAQARRVALWMARRHNSNGPVRTLPLRPWGLTPGRGSAALDRLTDNRLLYVAQAAQAALTLDIWNSS